MTTIVYSQGVIAYESRTTRGTTITDDDKEKMVIVDGVHFIFTGCTCDFQALRDAYFGRKPSAEIEASGFALDGENLYLIGCDDKTGLWKEDVDLDRPHAIGSGAAHAFTAIDMGATAVKAVELAIKRDNCSGGTIRTLSVPRTPNK